MATQIDYFGNTDLEKLILLIHAEFEKYVKWAGDAQAEKVLHNDFTDAYKKILDDIEDTFAKIDSPEFTGIPTAPTAPDDTNTLQIATTAYVVKAIANAMSKITGISFDGPYASYEEMVEQVTEPKTGIIYLVSNGGSAPNVNDEYFWKPTTQSFEKFGSTAVDLSKYVKIDDLKEITAAEVEAKWNAIFK